MRPTAGAVFMFEAEARMEDLKSEKTLLYL